MFDKFDNYKFTISSNLVIENLNVRGEALLTLYVVIK